MSRMGNIQSVLKEAAEAGVYLLVNPGVPDATTGVGIANKGCLCVNTVAPALYINSGDSVTPNWTLV
jgi:hypothetical protein